MCTLRGITYYKMGKRYYARSKSSLDAKRVKEDKAFQKTMQNAGLFGQASRIASSIYRLVDRDEKDIRLYRKWTGMALHFLCEGKTIEEARFMLYLKTKNYLGACEQKILETEMSTKKELPIININGYQAVFLPSFYHPALDIRSKTFAPDRAFRIKSKCLAVMR
ncbi:MAG: hypothetical protein JST58_03700 [Bacteroidetes bacterium]|nr:hypothetical protein [Bacteroidota bacterium]